MSPAKYISRAFHPAYVHRSIVRIVYTTALPPCPPSDLPDQAGARADTPEMALATDSYAYSRSSSFSAARSPDTASPIYPERAIRPLPKSRLKSKLSPEQVSSIKYPAQPPLVAPALHVNPPKSITQQNGDAAEGHYHRHEAALVHEHCSCQHGDGDSGDDEVEFDHPDYRYATSASPTAANGKVNQPHDSVQRRLMDAARFTHDGRQVTAAESASSSADGYESFENTSNKKKRKIPLTTISATHQSRLSAELANMGICQTNEEDEVVPSNHTTPADPGTGISGAGRGRYGRRDAKDGRRPLASTTVNTPNGYAARVPSKSEGAGDFKSHEYDLPSPTAQTPGIISRAIRTAAEAGPLTPQKGKENISLLHQSATSSAASPKTQFTFTCESDSGNKLVERERVVSEYAAPHHTSGQRGGTMNGSRGMQGQGPQAMHSPRAPVQAPHQQMQPAQQQSQMPPPASQKPPRPRRSPSKEYAMAARQRKMQQQYTNYHHRPRREDMWICQFCEYEDIFGVPPVALIRAYEIKDRQERKKAAEKRRLLEKAKQRGRKGKKGSKAAGGKNSGTAAPAPAQDQRYDQHGAPLDGEDYFDDDEDAYGDEYDPVGPDDDGEYDTGEYYEPPPPVPLGTPQLTSANRAGG
ncbi:hypothetical protein AMS68_001135 [Peltaster fructicola]|uniref:Uncharacterized protein n=1 Tax=Peltaster fructicola TaxID=286661 RepID=A0A6H0XLX0_9PEZI|nr:hypothetical protein AMS68_001135 [Peltaster fructicola]